MPDITLNKVIGETENQLRLDQALAQLFPEYSRAQIQHWIKLGFVTIDDGVETQPRKKVRAGQTVTIEADLPEQQNWDAQNIPLNIIYEDDDLIIVNKQTGLIVHPGAGVLDGTLVNALVHHDPELKKLPRAGIVHRIDKDTSGLLVVAKNLKSHHALSDAIQHRTVKREYETIVLGEMIAGGTIDAAIGRHPTQRTKMSVRESGRDAITHYRVLEKFPRFTYCRVTLETGRTHQIRVHMAHINHPIIGDPTYGSKNRLSAKLPDALKDFLAHFNRQALHAAQLTLTHPTTGETMSWQAPLPEDMQQLLDILRKHTEPTG